MKGIILAAGEGTRLAELNLKHKSFAVVQKKHIIDYSLDLLANIGHNAPPHAVAEIIIVVGHNADAVMNAIGNSYRGIPITYVYQKERKGIAHAVLTAKEALNDDFIMCLADEILLNSRMDEMVQAFYQTESSCFCGCVLDENDHTGKPIGYLLNEDGTIAKVMEKPQEYFNAYRGVGECIFSKGCLDMLDILQPNPKRGELEMGDWIQLCVDNLGNVRPFDLADAYVNVNYAKDIDAANKLLEDK